MTDIQDRLREAAEEFSRGSDMDTHNVSNNRAYGPKEKR